MEVSPQAKLFSDTHPIEDTDIIRKKMLEQFHEERAAAKVFGDRPGVSTVTGSKNVLQQLQDDLRKIGYRKLR